MTSEIKPIFENKSDKYKTEYKTFWKDKKGNPLTRQEYMSRWKQGIMDISPLQQAKVSYNSTIIMLIGILAGIIISIANFKNLWWVCIILTGAFGVTSIQLLGIWQKKKTLEKMDGILNNNIMEVE